MIVVCAVIIEIGSFFSSISFLLIPIPFIMFSAFLAVPVCLTMNLAVPHNPHHFSLLFPVFLSVCLLCVCLSGCLFISFKFSIYCSCFVCTSVCLLSVCLPVQSVCLFSCWSICLSTCYVHSNVHPFFFVCTVSSLDCLSICLFVTFSKIFSLFIHLSVVCESIVHHFYF